jgi:hypothetical protein
MAIKFPFGAAEVATLSATGAQAISITDAFTVIDGNTTIATGNRTLNFTINSQVPVGARCFLVLRTTGTETTIAGTGITMPTITGVAGKIKTAELVYDGTTFKALSVGYQID